MDKKRRAVLRRSRRGRSDGHGFASRAFSRGQRDDVRDHQKAPR